MQSAKATSTKLHHTALLERRLVPRGGDEILSQQPVDSSSSLPMHGGTGTGIKTLWSRNALVDKDHSCMKDGLKPRSVEL